MNDRIDDGGVDLVDAVFLRRGPEVDRIGWFHPGGKDVTYGLYGMGSQPGKGEVSVMEKIGCDNAATAGKGNDGGSSVITAVVCHGEAPQQIHHLMEVEHLNDPRLSECMVYDDIIARQTGRMAHGGRSAGWASASLENDDGFFGGSAQCHEMPGIGKRFNIQSDDLGVRIPDEVFQKLRFVNIALIPDGTEFADSHASLFENHHQEGSREHTALDDNRHVSRLHQGFPCVGVHEGIDMP